MHQARLLPRLLLVGFLMLASFGITGAIFWFSFVGVDDAEVGGRGGARTTEQGPVTTAAVSLPAGWPETLTPPAGATIVSSVAAASGTPDEQLVLVVEVDGEGPAVVAALRDQLAAAGLAVTGDAVTPAGVGSISATGAGWEASVSVSPVPARPGTTTVSWVLRAS